jgi:hypothetical protein
MDRFRSDRPKLEFVTVHTIQGSQETEVRISRAGDQRPLYSVQIGRRKKVPDEFNRLSPFVPVRIVFSGDSLDVDRSAEDLMRQAHEWIREDVKNFQANYSSADTRPRTEFVEEKVQRPSWDRDRGRDRESNRGGRGRGGRDRDRGWGED